MPLNVSGTLTPQQAMHSVATDSIKDQLSGGKIGDDQVLYSSGNGKIKGNRLHKWFQKDSTWQTEKENAKNDVVNWIKGFGLSETQTSELVSHVETKFQTQGELRGRDLKQIAKMAEEKLQPFAAKPFTCPKNATAKDVTKANLWLALNKGQTIGAKGNYQNGFTLVRDPNASLQQRANVPHAMFSMSPLAKRPQVLQVQMLRSNSQMPPIPAGDFKIESAEKFQPYESAVTTNEYNKEHDFREAGNAQWQPHDPQEEEALPYDSMQNRSANIGHAEYVKSTRVQQPPAKPHPAELLSDADLLEILDDEFGDEVEQLDINSDFLAGLRYLIYENETSLV